MSRTMFRLDALEAYSSLLDEKERRLPWRCCTGEKHMLVRPSPSCTPNGSTFDSYQAPNWSSVKLVVSTGALMPK